MTQCKLSDRQRNLLRVVAQGLKEHNAPGSWWIRMTHDHGVPQWQNVGDDDLREQLQADLLLGDVDMFERCGFLTNTQPGRYDLVVKRIIDVVDNEFFSDGKPRNSHGRRKSGSRKRKSRGRRKD